MIQNGFALERISDSAELAWWPAVPGAIRVPDEAITVDSPSVGWSFGDYRLVAKDREVPDPVPERRRIDKWLIVERLTDEQLSAALSLMTDRQKEKWRMPGYPSVYVDDEEVLALIAAIGADPDVVLA